MRAREEKAGMCILEKRVNCFQDHGRLAYRINEVEVKEWWGRSIGFVPECMVFHHGTFFASVGHIIQVSYLWFGSFA